MNARDFHSPHGFLIQAGDLRVFGFVLVKSAAELQRMAEAHEPHAAHKDRAVMLSDFNAALGVT